MCFHGEGTKDVRDDQFHCNDNYLDLRDFRDKVVLRQAQGYGVIEVEVGASGEHRLHTQKAEHVVELGVGESSTSSRHLDDGMCEGSEVSAKRGAGEGVAPET